MHTEHGQEDIGLPSCAQFHLQSNLASVSHKYLYLKYSTWLVSSFQLGHCVPPSHRPRIGYQSIFLDQGESRGRKDVTIKLDDLGLLELPRQNAENVAFTRIVPSGTPSSLASVVAGRASNRMNTDT